MSYLLLRKKKLLQLDMGAKYYPNFYYLIRKILGFANLIAAAIHGS